MVLRRTLLAAAATALAGCSTGPLLPVPHVADQSCPPLDLPEDRAVCSHTDGPGGIDVSATPSSVSTAPEALERVRLLIENGTTRPLRYDSSTWRLYRNRGTGWTELEGIRGGPRGVETMPVGGSASWSGIDAWLGLGGDERTPDGLYAAVLPVWPAGEDDGGAIACVPLVRVASA